MLPREEQLTCFLPYFLPFSSIGRAEAQGWIPGFNFSQTRRASSVSPLGSELFSSPTRGLRPPCGRRAAPTAAPNGGAARQRRPAGPYMHGGSVSAPSLLAAGHRCWGFCRRGHHMEARLNSASLLGGGKEVVGKRKVEHCLVSVLESASHGASGDTCMAFEVLSGQEI